jgi:tetratricopeptide (TPR) repeat protein
MKQRGDVFFRNGDFKSAINAYEQAIDGSDRQFVAALSNRAAARLKLGLAKTALNDCDEALALVSDPILTSPRRGSGCSPGRHRPSSWRGGSQRHSRAVQRS